MDVKEAIRKRRAHRALEPVEIDDELVNDLAESAQLAPSCFNNQPWRFVFVTSPDRLRQLHGALPEGNKWARNASMIIAVVTRKELDCALGEREYYSFDTGMATAFIILRATELGLVAHPIAGYDEEKAKETLGIPWDMRLITLVIVGKHSEARTDLLNDGQRESERKRPKRLPLAEIAFVNSYRGG